MPINIHYFKITAKLQPDSKTTKLYFNFEILTLKTTLAYMYIYVKSALLEQFKKILSTISQNNISKDFSIYSSKNLNKLIIAISHTISKNQAICMYACSQLFFWLCSKFFFYHIQIFLPFFTAVASIIIGTMPQKVTPN